MFVLAVIKDIIRIPPNAFAADQTEAVADEINRKFANKVCPGGHAQRLRTLARFANLESGSKLRQRSTHIAKIFYFI